MALSDTIGLLFNIRADGDQAVREMGRVRAEEKQMEGATSSLDSSFASMATKGGAIALTSLAAIGTAAATAGVAIFELIKQTSDYGSQIHDAAQKTGLSAQAISALKIAAEQSSSSLEAVTGGIVKFAKNYQGTSTELEASLGKIFKQINDAKPGFDQIKIATENFGRAGANLIPVVESFNGNLPGLIEHFEKLGVTLGQQNVDAADAFGDTLETLELQAGAVARQFAFELMPTFTRVLGNISEYLADNKDVAKGWGDAMVNTFRGVELTTQATASGVTMALEAITGAFTSNKAAAHSWADTITTEFGKFLTHGGLFFYLMDKLGAANPALEAEVTGKARPVPRVPKVPKATGAGTGKTAADDTATKELQAQIELQKILLDELERKYKATMASIRDEFKKTGDDTKFLKAAKDASDEFVRGLPAVLDALDKLEKKALKDPTPTQLTVLDAKQKERRDKIAELEKKDAEKTADEIIANDKKIADKRLAIAKQLADDFQTISQQVADSTIKNQEDDWDEQIANEKEFSKERIDLQGKATHGLTVLLEAERDHKLQLIDNENEARKKDILDNFADDETRAKLLADLQTINDDKKLLTEEEFQKKKKAIQDKYSTALPVKPGPSTIGELADTIKPDDTFGTGLMIEGLKAVEDAARGAGQAVGEMVGAWVLYGKIGTDIRKVTAQLLASLAQQAAARAVYELAEGFAALGMGLMGHPLALGAATNHFISAGIFGTIAGITALAGRAVAGNSFNQGAAGATGMTMTQGTARNAAPGGAYSGSSGEPTVIEAGINTTAPTIVIKDRTGMMGKLLEWEIDTNSRVRSLIVETAGAA